MEIEKSHSSLMQLKITMTTDEVSALETVLILARDKLLLSPEEQEVVKTIHSALLYKGDSDASSV